MWKVFFDGLGTELIGLVIGTLLGGSVGYNVGVKSGAKQIQKAGTGAQQQQNYTIEVNKDDKKCAKVNAKVNQLQTAEDNAIQEQSGRIRNE